ncbi:MAG: hypothetical protein FWF09_01430 [Bacteroidales bacterium]|nr:hypothetical protein [Bacteroidales bacterium]
MFLLLPFGGETIAAKQRSFIDARHPVRRSVLATPFPLFGVSPISLSPP